MKPFTVALSITVVSSASTPPPPVTTPWLRMGLLSFGMRDFPKQRADANPKIDFGATTASIGGERVRLHLFVATLGTK
jgi:hypothetical protein